MERGYMHIDLKEKLQTCNAILYGLFPNSEIIFLWGRGVFSDDYFLSIHNHKNERLGFLKVSMMWEKIADNCYIHSLQLYKDFTYQVDYSGDGIISWFKEGRYGKPENHQEIENILKEIWDILV